MKPLVTLIIGTYIFFREVFYGVTDAIVIDYWNRTTYPGP